MNTVYIGIAIVALVLIVVFYFFIRKKGKPAQKPSRLALLGMVFVIVSMFFSDINRFVGYAFIGVAVMLAVIDLIRMEKQAANQ
jgi:uncharacterized membrane protein